MEKFQKEQGRPIEDQEKSREAKELFKREKRFAYTQAILNWTERLSSVEIPGLAELLPSRKRGAAFLPAMLFTLAMGCNEWQESKPAVPGGKLIETSCGIDDREYIESSRDWIADNPELIQREMDLFWPDAVATARGLSETVQKARIICGFEEEDTALGAEAGIEENLIIFDIKSDSFTDALSVYQDAKWVSDFSPVEIAEMVDVDVQDPSDSEHLSAYFQYFLAIAVNGGLMAHEGAHLELREKHSKEVLMETGKDYENLDEVDFTTLDEIFAWGHAAGLASLIPVEQAMEEWYSRREDD